MGGEIDMVGRGAPAWRGGRLALVAVAALSGAGLVLAGPGAAATMTVTRSDDPPLTDPTGCSLRQAVQAAGANAGVGGCPAGETALDTILLPDSAFLSIAGADDTNAGGDLDVVGGGPLRIAGTGAEPSLIRGRPGERVLHVLAGSLTLERVVVTGGRATGTGADGYGGGILAVAGSQLTLTGSTVRANTAVQAAGISNGTRTGIPGGTVVVDRSTVSGNVATADSGGGMGGGGIGNINGTLVLVNSTVSGNVTAGGRGGGVYHEEIGTATTSVTILNSTVTGNTGAAGANLHSAASGAAKSLRLRSTIVSDGRNDQSCGSAGGGTITTLGFNLADDDSCRLTLTTDRQETEPLLGLLSDNGGDTLTHALLPGSPAIDAGSRDTAFAGIGLLTADQRGAPRPLDRPDVPNPPAGDAADIGAVESPLPAAPPVPPPPAAPQGVTPPPPDRAVRVVVAPGPLAVARRGVARLRVSCPRTEASPPCRGTLALRTRARVLLGGRSRQVTLAAAAFRIGAGSTVLVTLRLPASRLALVRGTPAARRVVAVATVRDAAGNRATVRRTLGLLPPAGGR